MPFPWMAAATFGAGLLSAGGQKQANAQNAALAREQMAFQERMSNTAYQRAAKDLEAAGLNRILALGSPASSPGGQTARMENTMAPIANATAQAAMQAAQIKLINAQAEKTKNEAAAIKPKAQIGETVSEGIDFVPSRLSPRKIDYGNIGTMFKKQVTDAINRAANSARAVGRNDRTGTSVQQYFQDRKPTRQEASQYQNVWNSLPTHWDDKQKLNHMVQHHEGRWPDWAMDMLYRLYPEARPK